MICIFFPLCIYILVLLDKINNNIKENMHTPLILSKKSILIVFLPTEAKKTFSCYPFLRNINDKGVYFIRFVHIHLCMIKLYIHFSYIAQINLILFISTSTYCRLLIVEVIGEKNFFLF